MSDGLRTALINGQPARTVSVCDRGLHYGDGLFETIAVFGGKPLRFEQHWQRLFAGCQRLAMTAPDRDSLFTESMALCRQSERAVLKIILTRGCSGRGYRPPLMEADDEGETGKATRILLLHDWPDHPAEYRERGITVRICRTRLSRNSVLAGVKHLNRLEQVLARNEWHNPAIAEGLMLDTDGNIIEGTMSNLFVIRESTLLTPDLTYCGIQGVMRAAILEQARRLGIATQIKTMRIPDLEYADEMFMCNSIIGIWPVGEFENRTFMIGPITRNLQQAIEAFAEPCFPPLAGRGY